jgi:hypothetical protein
MSRLLKGFQAPSGRIRSSTRARRVGLGVEGLEDRVLMSATQTGLGPGSLLIYYGYPSVINGAQTLSQAAAALGSYDDVVLGDGIEAPAHPDHANTLAILANPAMARTAVFGYIDLGVSTQNLSVAEMESRVGEWKGMGVKGVFLDDFGYDYGTTRARQNTVVAYAHAQGLAVVANAWNPADAFGSQADSAYNPSGAGTALNAGDFYLYEDYQVSEGAYASAADWQSKASTLASYQAALGFKVLATTTNNAANAFDQGEFNYAWYSALLAGYAAVGWGEFDYSAGTGQAPFRARPSVNAGTTYVGGVVANGSLFTRNTDLGQITVNTATHTGSFTPLAAAPSFTATAVSPTQINLSWTAAAGATGYAVDELVSGAWVRVANLGSGSLSYPVTGLRAGTTYTFRVGASRATGTAFANPQIVITFPAAPSVQAGALSATQVSLSWNAVAGATSYEIDMWIAGAWKKLGVVGGGYTRCTVSYVAPGTLSYFRVGATDAAGTDFSAYVGVWTPAY